MKIETCKFFLIVYLLESSIEGTNAKFYSKHSVKERDAQCWNNYLESKSYSAVECVSRCRVKGKRSLMVDDEKCFCVPWNNDSLEEACKIDEVNDDENDRKSVLYECKTNEST